MRRAVLLGAAALLTAGLAVAPAQAGKKTKVSSQVTIAGFTYNGPTDTVTFRGAVGSNAKCRKGRKVVLRQLEVPVVAGITRSKKSGKWKVRFTGDDVPPGNFRAIVTKKVIVKRRGGEVVKKTICKRDASPVFDAD